VLDLDDPFTQSCGVSGHVSRANFPRVRSPGDGVCQHVYVSVRLRLSRFRVWLFDVDIHKVP
jgi:hypothetical protein